MTKPNLLMLHGALGSAAQFEPIIPLLADHFEVYFPDFEGHGPRKSKRAFRIDNFAENALTVIDEQIKAPVDVFGYSMGGYVAAWLAHQHPDKVQRILTLGTKWLWTPPDAAREIGMMDADAIEAKVPQFAQMLKTRHSALGWREVLIRTCQMIAQLGASNMLTEEVLKAIQHPIRIAVGDRDSTVSVEESTRVFRVLPNAQLEVLPGTLHPIDKVGAERVAALITDWASTPIA
jgi:pimeloyl-ACP methyl ester carboxylesterase